MKVSYSKMILGGVIASTFLMVSCQKKGTATGVKPEVAQVQTQDKKETRTPAEPLTPLEARGPVTTDNKPKADIPKIQVPVNTSGDQTPAAPTAKPESKKEETKTTTVVTKKEEAKVDTKKSDEKTKVAVEEEAGVQCSESILAAEMDARTKFSAANELSKKEKAMASDKITAYTAAVKSCEALEAAYAKEKIESCEISTSKGPSSITINLWTATCDLAGVKAKEMTGKDNKYALRVEKAAKEALYALKSESLVVSEEAKPLFEKENQDFKMFLVDGTIQTDAIKLEDALKAKKVACTIIATPEKYSDSIKVSLTVQSIADYFVVAQDKTTEYGVEITTGVKAESDVDAVEFSKAKLKCTNLSKKNLNIPKLKAALGNHISIEAVKEQTKDEEVADESAETVAKD